LQPIEQLCENRRKVIVLGRYIDLGTSHATAPERTCGSLIGCVSEFSMLHRQKQSQPLDSHSTIVGLTPSFTRLGPQTSELMLDHDSRFDFIAMLTPWATAPLGSHHTAGE